MGCCGSSEEPPKQMPKPEKPIEAMPVPEKKPSPQPSPVKEKEMTPPRKVDLPESSDEEAEEPAAPEDLSEAEKIGDAVFGNAIKRLSEAKKLDDVDASIKELCISLLGEAKTNLIKSVSVALRRKYKKAIRAELDKIWESGDISSNQKWAVNLKVAEIEQIFIGLIPVGRVDGTKYIFGTETKIL